MASSSHVRFHAIRLEPGDELKSSLLSYIQKNNLRAGLKVFIISDNLHSYNSTGIPLKHFTFPLFLKLHNGRELFSCFDIVSRSLGSLRRHLRRQPHEGEDSAR